MILGIHAEWDTCSLYEMGAPSTFLTFKRTQVEFENFHAKSMSFRVIELYDTHHFRVIFSADEHTMDTLYSSLSVYTGYGGSVNS